MDKIISRRCEKNEKHREEKKKKFTVPVVSEKIKYTVVVSVVCV
jgi:hypothetical protein